MTNLRPVPLITPERVEARNHPRVMLLEDQLARVLCAVRQVRVHLVPHDTEPNTLSVVASAEYNGIPISVFSDCWLDPALADSVRVESMLVPHMNAVGMELAKHTALVMRVSAARGTP